ncbi:zinc finger BED domain-containing protein 5-like [Diabrotica undecimpunctata]|uniref:zinc finger BED domain-containing protein 5-like n=1 Tax=Diabrotica undecimpunctata TaxID=50387 RepID=UPI003B63901A
MKRVCKNENENATEASFIVGLHIAKAGKLHTIAKELIKPCVKDVLDESTDVAGHAVLLVFVKFPFGMKIEEELLMCEELKSYATGEDIFKAIHEYIGKNDIELSKCMDICSDGAAAMVGKIRRAVSRIKVEAENAFSSHCILHRHSLATKKMLQDLKDETVSFITLSKDI